MDAPDMVEAIVGWRAWDLAPGHRSESSKPHRLASLNTPRVIWPTRNPLKASE